MAELSSQDVVNKVQSTDAPASVDVSASTHNAFPAGAANTNAVFSNSGSPATSFDNHASTLVQSRQSEKSDATEQAHSLLGLTLDGNKNRAEILLDDQAHNQGKQTGNGVHDDSVQTESEGGTRSATASVGHSAASEGEMMQIDGSEATSKTGESFARSAAKKPSSFKAVSVTKSFLAKTGTPSQPAKTINDAAPNVATLASSFASNTARPRLVAKTGSGHKLTMSSHLSGSKAAGQVTGPDPMQVWNRNRVQAPQATPKHLTNEELREQYGIQLASIPLGDGDDKGNKWADIDDEEDDWAPEVIEWSDGSKVNLAEAEKKAAAEKEKAAAEAKKREEAAKAAALAARPTQSLGPNATVLKVGGAAQAKAANDLAATFTKGTDKPTLVAKPIATPPVKSPWATLPPVDKAPPVPVNPPAQPAAGFNRHQHPEAPLPDRGPAPWRQAKEIEADDFSRIPRDAPNSVPSQLFNSQSGKYEPVNDGRRGSMKREQNFRPPSVLQRPGPDQDIPQFLSRRRDSESQPPQPEPEENASITRQQGDVRASVEQPQVWRRQPGAWVPSHMRNGSQTSPSATHALPVAIPVDGEAGAPAQSQVQQATGQPQEDPLTVQKRLMREAREAAIKRRQEDAAKEEAEKKERIRKKLEAMGPPPEKKEKDKPMEDTPPMANASIASLPKSGDESNIAGVVHHEIARSPPKPPVPTAAGPPQQYGMIKVHPTPLPNGPPTNPSSSAGPASKTAEGNKSPAKTSPIISLASTTSVFDSKGGLKPHLETSRLESSHHDKNRWGVNVNQTSKGWERPSDVPNMVPNSSLWSSGSHRNLGNGDFSNLNAQSRGQFRQQQISPDSILPSPQSVAPPRLFHEEKPSTAAIAGPHLQAPPGVTPKPENSTGTGGPPFGSELPSIGIHPQPPATQSRTPGLPSPLSHNHPSQHNMLPPPKPFTAMPEHKSSVDAWANFASNVADHDTAARTRMAQERSKQLAEAHTQGRQPASRHYNETWKQVSRGDDVGSRHVIGIQTTTRTQQQPSSSASIVDDLARQPPVTMPPQHPRPSRFHTFFGQHEQSAPVSLPARQSIPMRPASPPMPPPDSLQHPVFDRISNRPRVRLPGQEYEEIPERPVVKLPPPKALPQHPVIAELRGMPPPLRGPAQPLAKTLSWQHRFDGLFNRSLEKRTVEPTEFSSSKSTFDIVSVNEAASVSFPQPGQISPVSPRFAKLYTAGRTIDEEEALFDGEQDPGSTPPVCVPPNKYPITWRPAPVPSPARRVQLFDHDVLSRFPWAVGLEDFIGKKVIISIRLPTMAVVKRLEIAAANIRSPRVFTKSTAFPKGKPPSKGVRKPKEAQQRPVSQLTQITKPAPAQAAVQASQAPTTWAKRVSAGI